MRTRSQSLTVASMLACLATSLACTACGSMSDAKKPPAPPSAIVAKDPLKNLAGTWNLTHLGGQPIEVQLAPGGKAPSLTIAKDGGMSGFAGVNRIAGGKLDALRLAKGEFPVSDFVSTKMAGPPQAMQVEDSFLASLRGATGYRLSDKDRTLSISGAEGETLRFVRGIDQVASPAPRPTSPSGLGG